MTVQELAVKHNWNMPTVCPCCGADLVISDNHKQLTCSNDFCKSRFSGRISKWAEKLQIMELGLTTIETLYDAGVFSTISDLYKIDYKKIENLDGFGKRSADIIKGQIEAHKQATLAQFISGYNIPGLGEKIVQKIADAKKLGTFDEFVACTDYTCEGVGQITAEKLRKGIDIFENDMRETLKYVTILAPKAPVAGNLGGKSFCFTGAASRPRKELWELVEKNGGIVHETMKKDTSFLVLADPNSTSSKAVKARKQGTTLISEEDFVNMCNG